MRCGSRIQPARFPRLLGSAPAAMVCRLARWVRSGPTVPLAGVPRTLWHKPHDPVERTVCPRRLMESVGAEASESWCWYQEEKLSGGTTTTRNFILACWSPQNSAHRPWYTPTESTRNVIRLVYPG